MIQSEYPLCPKHQNPIRFIDIQENVPKIQRTLCDECYLNNPLSIHQAFDYLCQQQNTPFQQETTFEKCKEEYLVMKNKVVENLKLAFAQIEMEIEKEMDSQKTLINDSVFQYYLGKQTTLLLEDYQQLGELLSVQLEKGENLIQKQNEKFLNLICQGNFFKHPQNHSLCESQPKMEVLTPNDLLVKLDGQFIVKQQLDNLENIKCIDYHRQLQTLIYGCYKFQMDQNEMVIIRFDKNFNVFLKEEYTSHSRTVNCIKSSLISNFCITGSEDSTVKVWKIVQEGLCCEQTLEGHQDSIICICLNRVESILASGSSDNHIIVWYLNVQNKWQKAQTIVDSPRITLCINFNRLSELMVTGCIDHSIYVWSVVNEKWREHECHMFYQSDKICKCFLGFSNKGLGQAEYQLALCIVNLILIEESNHLISCAYDTTVIWSIDPQDLIVKKQKITAAKGICQINEQKLSIITYENQLKIYSLEQ